MPAAAMRLVRDYLTCLVVVPPMFIALALAVGLVFLLPVSALFVLVCRGGGGGCDEAKPLRHDRSGGRRLDRSLRDFSDRNW